MIKLQVVEYESYDLRVACYKYRYILELDGRWMLHLVSVNTILPTDYVIKELMKKVHLLTDIDLEHYNRFNKMPGIAKKVLFEQEVSDHYLKDLKIQQRINDLEKDFI